MELTKMLAELRSERAVIEEGILALERLARSQGGRRRGRPPAWLASGATSVLSGVKRKRSVSAKGRKRMAAAQKKRWAAYRRAKAASSHK